MGMPLLFSQFNFNRYAVLVLAVGVILSASRTHSQPWASCSWAYGLRQFAI